MRRIFERLIEARKKRANPKGEDFEWDRFQRIAREQFKRLQAKGLSIPVVTL